jgi:hypothetical protein
LYLFFRHERLLITTTKIKAMKKIISSLAFLLLIGISTSFAAGPGDQMHKIFKELFPGIENVNWTEQNGTYTAYFSKGNIQTRAYFNAKGDFIGALRYYSEDELPLYLLLKLHDSYHGVKIFGVTEKSNKDGINYYIKLVDDKHWYDAFVDNDGNLEKTSQYDKAE